MEALAVFLSLSLVARPVAGLVTPLASSSGLFTGPVATPRCAVSVVATHEFYGGQQAQAYSGQQGYGGQQGSSSQLAWRILGHNGVAGFSGVKGFVAENKNSQHTWESDDEDRPCALPYVVQPGQEQVLSRWNMKKQAMTVSRIQAIVTCNHDGTATLTSKGKQPTLWRAGGAPWKPGGRLTAGSWNILAPGKSTLLTDGDQVSLHSDDPEAAVFTCEKSTVASKPQGQSGYAQQGQTAGYAQQGQSGYAQQDQSGYAEQGQPYVQQQAQALYVQANYDFLNAEPGQLSFRAGDFIQVTQQGPPGEWWGGALNGQVGWFPANYCSEPWIPQQGV